VLLDVDDAAYTQVDHMRHGSTFWYGSRCWSLFLGSLSRLLLLRFVAIGSGSRCWRCSRSFWLASFFDLRRLRRHGCNCPIRSRRLRLLLVRLRLGLALLHRDVVDVYTDLSGVEDVLGEEGGRDGLAVLDEVEVPRCVGMRKEVGSGGFGLVRTIDAET
jgi:hypothetical protein